MTLCRRGVFVFLLEIVGDQVESCQRQTSLTKLNLRITQMLEVVLTMTNPMIPVGNGLRILRFSFYDRQELPTYTVKIDLFPRLFYCVCEREWGDG